jgi:hypothetical protein
MAIATNVVANGSSTTAGLNARNSYITLYKVNDAAITFNNLAIGGEVYTDLIARESAINALRLVGALNVYWLQPFSNDYPISGGLNARCFSAMRAHVARMKLARWTIVLVNQLPRSLSQYNEYRNTYQNPSIASMVSEGRADFLMNWGNDPVIGTDAAGCDTSIIGDGIHPTQWTHDYGYANYVVPIMARIRPPGSAATDQASY